MFSNMSRNDNIRVNRASSIFLPPELEKIRNSASAQEIHMQIGPEEGSFLMFLVKFTKAVKILELGTFMGFSAACMAYAAPKDAKIISLEKDPNRARIATKNILNAHLDNKVSIIVGTAPEALYNKTFDLFDMIFLDCSKIVYPQCVDFSINNLRKGGLLVIDNTMIAGSHKMWLESTDIERAMSRTIEKVSKKFNFFSVPSESGMILAELK